MKDDYDRSTQATTLAELPEPLLGAIRAKAEAQQLTVADDAPAYLTYNRRLRKPGLLARMTKSADGDTEHWTALVLGARDVFVGTHGDERGTIVLTARLEDVYTEALLPGIGGVSVTGFPASGEATSASYFVGLGPPEGDAARAALESAIRAAKV